MEFQNPSNCQAQKIIKSLVGKLLLGSIQLI